MLVWATYVVCGVGIAYIYRCDDEGIKGNILQNLPLTSGSAVVVRVAYALVCATSYPLTLVPVAGMIKPVLAIIFGSNARRTHTPLADAESGESSGAPVVSGGGGEGSARERCAAHDPTRDLTHVTPPSHSHQPIILSEPQSNPVHAYRARVCQRRSPSSTVVHQSCCQ